ncbi:hypothetical protein GOODEAATRI_019458 [Goodea atripinnis]|uniref:Uncharacterized protein n=1 Tax=Goodea atripinnis TaxID=208336 RepID=A0ABV0MJ47_9TELE
MDQRPHYYKWDPSLPVHLLLHSTIPHEQATKISELLCLRQKLAPDCKGAMQLFLDQDYGFRLTAGSYLLFCPHNQCLVTEVEEIQEKAMFYCFSQFPIW